MVDAVVHRLPIFFLVFLLNWLGIFRCLTTAADRPGLLHDTCNKYFLPILGLASGIVTLFAGGYQLFWGQTMGSMATIQINSLEKGVQPRSPCVKIEDGRFLLGTSVTSKHKYHEHSTGYYPLVSAVWKDGDPISVVVKAPIDTAKLAFDTKKFDRGLKRLMAKLEAESRGLPGDDEKWAREDAVEHEAELNRLMKGVLTRRGLPGFVTTSLENSGYRLADSYYMLDCMSTPESEARFGLFVMGIAVAIMVVSGIFLDKVQLRRDENIDESAQSSLTPNIPFSELDYHPPHVRLGADGKDGIMYKHVG